jgi:hypothetical protein
VDFGAYQPIVDIWNLDKCVPAKKEELFDLFKEKSNRTNLAVNFNNTFAMARIDFISTIIANFESKE